MVYSLRKQLSYYSFRKRFDFASHARKLATSEWDDEDEDEEDYESNDMDVEEFAIKPPRSYKDQARLT